MAQRRGRPGAARRPAPRRGLSFGAFLGATSALPAHARLEYFFGLPSALRDEAWRGLRVECDQWNQAANRAAAELSWPV